MLCFWRCLCLTVGTPRAGRPCLRFRGRLLPQVKILTALAYADFVACHNASYIDKYQMVEELKPGVRQLSFKTYLPENCTLLESNPKKIRALIDVE